MGQMLMHEPLSGLLLSLQDANMFIYDLLPSSLSLSIVMYGDKLMYY